MATKWIRWGAIFALFAVALGAFGAHGLKAMISPERLEIFQTGVKYQFYHAFALLFLGIWAEKLSDNSMITWAGHAFLAGILLFSGSLYLLSLRDILSWPVAWLGPITPLGGLLFIIGWGCVLLALRKSDH